MEPTYGLSFYHLTTLRGGDFSYPHFIAKETETEKLSNLLEVPQLLSSRAMIGPSGSNARIRATNH